MASSDCRCRGSKLVNVEFLVAPGRHPNDRLSFKNHFTSDDLLKWRRPWCVGTSLLVFARFVSQRVLWLEESYEGRRRRGVPNLSRCK